MNILLRCVPTLLLLCLSLASFKSTKAQEAQALNLQISRTLDGRTQLNWTPLPGNPNYSVKTRFDITSPWINLNSSTSETQLAIETTSTQQFFRVVANIDGVVEIPNRGRLISAEKVGEIPSLTLQFLLLFLPGLPEDADRSVPYNVDLYKLSYETIDPSGQTTFASAGLAIPQGIDEPLPMVSYQHPTVLKRTEVPSNPDSSENLGGVFMAAGGFLTVMPDYLGLGESDLFHPFLLAKPTATASVDALRAAKTFAANNAIDTTDELFLLGYSEGGYATMALHRELQESHNNEFPVSASAPLAGPYDLSGTVRDAILANDILAEPYQLPYVVASLTRYEAVGLTFPEMLRADLSSSIPPLFNGRVSGAEINPLLPVRPSELLSDVALAALVNPTHPLVLGLQRNDLLDWAPLAPMLLLHCLNDNVVSYQNSQRALERFNAQGATSVTLIDPGMDLDHFDCAIPSIVAARQWINSLR